MNAKIVFVICVFCAFVQAAQAELKVKVARTSGDVRIRRGVEEAWHPTSPGTWLEEVDSIVTGEAAEVTLLMPDGSEFRLGANAILDIADLRKISEQELFLHLMSRKVQGIEPNVNKSQLKIGNIHVVHGADKADSAAVFRDDTGDWRLFKNGARALYMQSYYPNAILKLNKILSRYPGVEDCGEVHLYLGKSFEALDKPGQAIDAYQVVVTEAGQGTCEAGKARIWLDEAGDALRRLNR